ncbi:hypothetical protein [Symbiopectobacterium purcellii]|uniref:hypothetical protein n=1 Tax=Symbiopectobacterium purcellii TaxID=2871826 RepID=UPI003F85C3DD
MARGRRQKTRPDSVINQLEPHIQDFIITALSTHTSPEVISGSLVLEFGLSVSKNSLYRYSQAT